MAKEQNPRDQYMSGTCTFAAEDVFETFQPKKDQKFLASLSVKHRWRLFQWRSPKRQKASLIEIRVKVETRVKDAWALTSKAARKVDDPGVEAEYWNRLLEYYSGISELMETLRQKYPGMFKDTYALWLDHRDGAKKRLEQANEEAECLAQGIPTGLFQPM